MTFPSESDPWAFVDFDQEDQSPAVADADLTMAIEALHAEVAALRLAVAANARSSKSPSSFLTPDEAAHHLRLNRKALYQRVARGQFKVVRLGRALRFRRADLDALLRNA